MSALDKVLDFSIDDWADAQRWSKSPQAALAKQAQAELAALRAVVKKAYDLVDDPRELTVRELSNALAKMEPK